MPFPDSPHNQPPPYYGHHPFWLALVVGNSRLHWAQFAGSDLCATWDTPHMASLAEGIGVIARHMNITAATPDLWIASVVPAQSAVWQQYSPVHFVNLSQIPLPGIYRTLGVDRALAAWGASITWGSPVLVIDGGTALTFTGIDGERRFRGGAILPGLHLQFQTLHQSTASLPRRDDTDTTLPGYWAADTETAIASGVIYTLLASIKLFVENWWQQYPGSAVVLTGGDGAALLHYLHQWEPTIASHITVDPHLIFQSIQFIREQQLQA